MVDITKLTVNLHEGAYGALLSTAHRENVSKTDVVNRALILYDDITRRLHDGDTLMMRDPKGGMYTLTIQTREGKS